VRLPVQYCKRRLTDCHGHTSERYLPYYLISILKEQVIFTLVSALTRNLFQMFSPVDIELLMEKLTHRN
jgi:hypothetical protein